MKDLLKTGHSIKARAVHLLRVHNDRALSMVRKFFTNESSQQFYRRQIFLIVSFHQWGPESKRD